MALQLKGRILSGLQARSTEIPKPVDLVPILPETLPDLEPGPPKYAQKMDQLLHISFILGILGHDISGTHGGHTLYFRTLGHCIHFGHFGVWRSRMTLLYSPRLGRGPRSRPPPFEGWE